MQEQKAALNRAYQKKWYHTHKHEEKVINARLALRDKDKEIKRNRYQNDEEYRQKKREDALRRYYEKRAALA